MHILRSSILSKNLWMLLLSLCFRSFFVFAQELPSTLSSADKPASSKVVSSRSRWAMLAGLGYAYETSLLGSIKRTDKKTKDFGYTGAYYYTDVLLAQVGTAFFLSESCKFAPESCSDVLAYGMLEYQYKDAQSTSAFQIRLGIETDLFFGKQRVLAWVNRLGVGYAYDRMGPSFPLDETEEYTYTLEEDRVFAQKLVFSLETGLLLQVPGVKGLGIYALFGISPKLAFNSGKKGFYGDVSTMNFLPTLSLRYRF